MAPTAMSMPTRLIDGKPDMSVIVPTTEDVLGITPASSTVTKALSR